MGNSIPQRSSSEGVAKVILSDGTVHRYDESLTVAELMLEYPQQVVFELHPVTSGKKPTPLPADNKLDQNKVYLMLPVRRGKPASLSSEEARRLLFRANGFLKSKSLLSTSGFLPLLARICPADNTMDEEELASLPGGRQRNKIKLQQDEESKTDYFEEILEGRPDYLSKQLSGKGWKPSLDTIKEKSIKMKVRHWLF